MSAEATFDESSFGLAYYNSGGDLVRYEQKGKGFDIIAIEKDSDTSDVFYTVETVNAGEDSTFIIPKMDAINSRKVIEYARYGLDVDTGNARIVSEIFRKKEDKYIFDDRLKVMEAHSKLGVKACEDENGEEIFLYQGYSNPITMSKYRGFFDVKPRGEKKEWYQFVQDEIADSTALQFVVSVSFAAILSGFMREVIEVENLIVHLCGESSSGKSTSLILAASVFGNPNLNCPNGLLSSWNGTTNALLARLMQVNGVLMGMDEFSMNKNKNVSSMLYAISSGMEKERMNRDATLKERLSGRFILLSTGESGILTKTNGNIGLTVRVLELDSQAWTSSAEQSLRIKTFVRQNYGHAAEDFGLCLGRWIQKNSMDELVKKYNDWCEYYCKRCKVQAKKERMSLQYGLILLAAWLEDEFFHIGTNAEKICDFLIENESTNDNDRDSFGDFYNRLVSHIIMNKTHFSRFNPKRKGEYIPAHGENWGIIEPLKKRHVINGETALYLAYIHINKFEDMAEGKFGCEDSKAIEKWLKKKGYTLCESGRDYYRKITDGVRLKYIAVYLIGEEQEEPKKKLITQSQNLKSMLEDDTDE